MPGRERSLPQTRPDQTGKYLADDPDLFPYIGIDEKACLHELYQFAGTFPQYHILVQLVVV